MRLVDGPDFPEAYTSESLIGAAAWPTCAGLAEGPDWTYLSPSPVIAPGERTGSYRLGLDSPAGDFVSAEDYAAAPAGRGGGPPARQDEVHRRLRVTRTIRTER